MKTKIDIIIPCYNPIGNWVNNLIENYNNIQLNNLYDYNFILVNDGSNQGISTENIRVLKRSIDNFIYISYPENKGKGYAIRYGFKHSESNITFFTDVDFPYGTDIICQMIPIIHNGNDIILSLRDQTYYNQISFSRKIVSQFLKACIKIFFKIPYSDTQGGLKGFSKKGKNILLSTSIDRYLFDLELVKKAAKNELNITGIYCQLKPNIILSSIGINILMKEFSNFYKIWKI